MKSRLTLEDGSVFEGRSFGFPQSVSGEVVFNTGMVTAVLVHERLMDLVAARLGVDPARVRRVNFVPAARMPYVSVTNHPYESGDYAAALDTALREFDYAGARKEQEEARGQPRH